MYRAVGGEFKEFWPAARKPLKSSAFLFKVHRRTGGKAPVFLLPHPMQPRRKSNFARRLRQSRQTPGGPLRLPGDAGAEEDADPPENSSLGGERASDPESTGEVDHGQNGAWAEDPTGEDDSAPVIPQRRRRPHVRRTRERLAVLRAARFFLALLLAGVVGFALHALTTRRPPTAASMPSTTGKPASSRLATAVSPPANPGELSPAAAAAAEAAYATLKAGRPADARTRFLALAAREDVGPEPRAALDRAVAWCDLAAGNPDSAERTLLAQAHRGEATADTHFLLGLARLQQGDLSAAQEALSHATALDPSRADAFFLWGDTLRREGNPRESIEKFQAASRRNRQETNEEFYRLKLLLSQLQIGDPVANAAIDGALKGHAPPGTAWLAAAARALGDGNITAAAGFLRSARPATDPVVFSILLQDPVFSQEAWRPELADFFTRSDPGSQAAGDR